MTSFQIELPDATAQAARAAGLLTPEALDRLLNEALRKREAANALLSIAQRVEAAGLAPMSMQEIHAEVKAARAARRSQG
jgi:hypothetical protein